MNTVLAAWIRLSEPRIRWGSSVASVMFAILVTFVTFSLLRTEGSVMAFGGGRLHPTDFAGPTGPAMMLERVVMLLGLIGAALSAHQQGDLYSGRAIRVALLAEPRRVRLMTGSLVATSVFLAALSAGTALLTVAVAYAMAPSAGVDISAWRTADSARETAVAVLSLVVGVLAYGVAGGALGTILRSSGAAVVVAGAYGLFEGAVAAFAGPQLAYFPGQVFAAAARGGTPTCDLGTALAATGAWCVALYAGAAVVAARRDVTV